MNNSPKSTQIQKSGDSSVNIQAKEINIGLSYDEFRSIAQDVWEANFYRLSGIAIDTAKERAEEIVNKYLKELKKRNPEGLDVARDPDFQYSLFNVQKDYARTGDKDLGEILVDILVDRSKESNRNIRQIVLNESLETASKLTKHQFAALSIIFIYKYTIYERMNSLDELKKYIDALISPFVPSLVKNATCYQHLEYTGCGSIGISQNPIEDIYLKSYPGLFVKGFTKESISDLIAKEPRLSQLISPCFRDSNLLQINSVYESVTRETASELGIDSSTIDKLLKVQTNHSMNSKEIKDLIISIHPCMKNLYDVWDNSYMKNFTLTSVGIAIGHANIRRVTGNEFDLSIWINE
jgi:hypothetical protein